MAQHFRFNQRRRYFSTLVGTGDQVNTETTFPPFQLNACDPTGTLGNMVFSQHARRDSQTRSGCRPSACSAGREGCSVYLISTSWTAHRSWTSSRLCLFLMPMSNQLPAGWTNTGSTGKLPTTAFIAVIVRRTHRSEGELSRPYRGCGGLSSSLPRGLACRS